MIKIILHKIILILIRKELMSKRMKAYLQPQIQDYKKISLQKMLSFIKTAMMQMKQMLMKRETIHRYHNKKLTFHNISATINLKIITLIKIKIIKFL